jgi:hypothetical protein
MREITALKSTKDFIKLPKPTVRHKNFPFHQKKYRRSADFDHFCGINFTKNNPRQLN